jgi:S-(hydroxymethyl)glutathione dehydrogenase / alcohol dehydrogenase
MAHKVDITVGPGEDINDYLMLTANGTCIATCDRQPAGHQVTVNLAMLPLMQKNRQGTIVGGGNPHYDIPHCCRATRRASSPPTT